MTENGPWHNSRRNGRSPTAIHVLLRDALLIGAVPAVTGWDNCLKDDAPPPELL